MSVEWRKVEGYENYSVSDTGLVRSERTGKYLAFSKDRYGYLHTSLSKNGIIKQFGVHRVVAKAFIPNPNNLDTVDHINGIKEDNRVVNLQWLSNSDNLEKYWGQRRKPVRCIENGVIYLSAYRAGIDLGLPYQHITEACTKKRKSVGGYHFEYSKEQAV